MRHAGALSRTHDGERVGESRPTRIVLAGTDGYRLRVWAHLLGTDPDLAVVATVADLAGVGASLVHTRPDVLVVDVGASATTTTDDVVLSSWTRGGAPVLVLGETGDGVREALFAGARGYALASERQEIALAVRALAGGRVFLSPRAAIALGRQGEEARARNGFRQPRPALAINVMARSGHATTRTPQARQLPARGA